MDATQTRDPAGHLLAYVYFTDTDLINLDIVHDGQAFADRRVTHSLHQQIEQAENEARKKQRGMWKEMKWNDQPEWRQEWVREPDAEKTVAGVFNPPILLEQMHGLKNPATSSWKRHSSHRAFRPAIRLRPVLHPEL